MNPTVETWDEVPLGELASRITKGTTPKTYGFSYCDEGVRFVKAESLNRLRIVHSLCSFVGEDAHNAFRRSQLEPNDVLFTIAGTLGRVAVVSDEDVPANTNQAVAIIKLKKPETAQFVARFLSGVNAIASGGRGTGLQNLNLEQVSAIRVPLPPLAEQHRIVSILDRLMDHSKNARHELARVLQLAVRQRRAVLAKAFRGELLGAPMERHIKRLPLLDVMASTFYGPRISSDAYVDDGIPTLRTTDIGDWGRLVPQTPPRVKVTAQEFERWGFKDQDLMVTRTGATIGKCALYRGDLGPALPSAYLIRLRLKLDIVDAKYVLLFLLSPQGEEQLLKGRTATAQPNINSRAISDIHIPLPKLEVQRNIVCYIEKAFLSLDRVEAESTRAFSLLSRLEQAALAKAFRGEFLVPQRATGS